MKLCEKIHAPDGKTLTAGQLCDVQTIGKAVFEKCVPPWVPSLGPTPHRGRALKFELVVTCWLKGKNSGHSPLISKKGTFPIIEQSTVRSRPLGKPRTTSAYPPGPKTIQSCSFCISLRGLSMTMWTVTIVECSIFLTPWFSRQEDNQNFGFHLFQYKKVDLFCSPNSTSSKRKKSLDNKNGTITQCFMTVRRFRCS